MTFLLDVTGLSVSYGTVPAVRDVSIQVGAGDLRVILGANGAGKSTIIRTILGLKKPASGSIVFEGRQIAGLPPHEVSRLGISWLPEGRRLWSSLSVMDNLKMGAFADLGSKAAAERLGTLLEQFPILSTRQSQLAGSLSGGEQQIVALARALMPRPKLILMDEPSLGLAPLMVRQVFEVISEINRTGVTILMVEQNARQAFKVAVWAYLLEVGQIVMGGPTEEIVASPMVQEVFLGRSVGPRDEAKGN